MNNFLTALEYEKSQQKMADDFYKKVFGDDPIEIKRWDYNKDEYSRSMQKKGIDVTLKVKKYGHSIITKNGLKNGPIELEYNISEKFRMNDWDDMFIELYSKFPNTIGWGHQYNADYIAYFMDSEMYVVNNQHLTSLVESISHQLSKDFLSDIFSSKGNNSYIYSYRNKTVKVFKIPTYINHKLVWEGVGVCIKWKDLDDLGVYINKHKLWKK